MLWSEYNKYKKFCVLPDKEGETNDQQDPNSLDERCAIIILGVVQVLCQVPKNRLVESAVRTFFFPFPAGTYLRPYEPHLERVHLLPYNKTAAIYHGSTSVAMTSYIPEFDKKDEPFYTVDLRPFRPLRGQKLNQKLTRQTFDRSMRYKKTIRPIWPVGAMLLQLS